MIEVLKVSSKSNPNSVAGALAGVVRANGSAEIQVVGAGALNQAIKAVAIARGYMAAAGRDLTCRPTFADIRIDGESRTAIRLQVDACEAISGPAQAGGESSSGVAPTDAAVVDAAASDQRAVAAPALDVASRNGAMNDRGTFGGPSPSR